jgi:ATP-binding protein involved in chromosome partitioning
VKPFAFSETLGVVSLEMLLGDRDAAVIWRGPLKISAIRQFISDIEWGALDFLIVDSPPGTGDEPLTVAQTIPDAEALIVTTPQEISLADVRKSINFCKQVNMKTLGLVENMSGFVCPHCGETIDLFGTGGGERTAREMGIPFLGAIPTDPRMVALGDQGKLDRLTEESDLEINRAYENVVKNMLNG